MMRFEIRFGMRLLLPSVKALRFNVVVCWTFVGQGRRSKKILDSGVGLDFSGIGLRELGFGCRV